MKNDYGTVVVTGGTRGIGAAIAAELETRGANVVATGTSAEQVADLNKSNSGSIEYLHLDFLDSASLDTATVRLRELKRIDALVNNAGVNRINPIWDMKTEDWDLLMEVNLKGVFKLTQSVASRMKEQGAGRILNIASIFGVVSKEKRAAYSTTKFGLLGFTKGIAHDLGPHNVLVNALSPGFVMTELTKSILSEQEMEDLAGDVSLQRFAQPGK